MEHHAFSKEDDAAIIEGKKAGLFDWQIAAKLGRTKAAVKNRRLRIGIAVNRPLYERAKDDPGILNDHRNKSPFKDRSDLVWRDNAFRKAMQAAGHTESDPVVSEPDGRARTYQAEPTHFGSCCLVDG